MGATLMRSIGCHGGYLELIFFVVRAGAGRDGGARDNGAKEGQECQKSEDNANKNTTTGTKLLTSL